LQYLVTGASGNDPVMKQRVDLTPWQYRQDVLISSHAVWSVERIETSLQHLIPRQRMYGRRSYGSCPLRQVPPIGAIPDAQMTTVTAEQLVRPLSDQSDFDVLSGSLTNKIH